MPTFRVFDVDALPTTQDLLSEALVNIVASTPELTDIAIGSKLWSMSYAIARQQASIYYTLYFYKKQAYILTASGKYLDIKGVELGVFRQKAISARGEATFSRTSVSTYKILIPSGTVVTTPVVSSDVEVTKFVTVEDVYLEAGELSVTVVVAAAVAGEAGNLPAGAISRLEAPIAGIQYVTATSTSGGIELEDDESFRERLLVAWEARMSGTANALKSAVLAVQGIRSVIIIDPAKNRVQQHYTISSVDGHELVSLETQTPVTAKYDISVELSYLESGLSLNMERLDTKGNLVDSELVTGIADGVDLLQKVNYWSQSVILQIKDLAIDDNPYDDLNPLATDNHVLYVRSTSIDVSKQIISLLIHDSPSGQGKRLVVSTTMQFKHNSILGQTELTPLVEVIEPFTTYEALVAKVNAESQIVQMTLLDKKIATEKLTPSWNATYNKNVVQTTFKPIIEILTPANDPDVVILNADEGIVSVGSGAVSTEVDFSYRYQTPFGSYEVGDVSVNLDKDGSHFVYARALTEPDANTETSISHLSEIPAVFPKTKMISEYEYVDGRIDIIPVPYALPIATDVLEEVTTACEKMKAAGIEVYITTPDVEFLDVSVVVDIETEGGAVDATQFYNVIKANITNYINGLDMGETAYRDRIIAAANPEITGLKVAHIVTPLNDVTPAPLTFIKAGLIKFT